MVNSFCCWARGGVRSAASEHVITAVRCIHCRSLAVLLSLLVVFSGPLTAETGEKIKPRILLVYSYHPQFPTSSQVMQGIESVFPKGTIELDVEYMDTKRLLDETILDNFKRQLTYKLSKRQPYDFVISADDNALNFLLAQKSELFHDTPLIFLGVNNIEYALAMNDVIGVTGIIEAASFSKTISLSGQLFPERKNIWVLTDGTPSGQADLQSIKNNQHLFPELNINELSLTELNWETWEVAIDGLSEKDVIVLLSAYRDRDNVSKDFSQSLEILMTHAKVPVFHFWEHGLGEGVLGGHIVSHYEQGRQAALMAQRALQGESVDAINVLAESPNVAKFDAQVLEKFGISLDRLPENAVVINLPEKYERYRRYLILSLVIGSILFIVFLITWCLQRKVAYEKSLLRQLIDSTPDLIAVKDQDQNVIASNKAFLEFVGLDEKHPQTSGRSHTDALSLQLKSLPSGRTEKWLQHYRGYKVLLDIYKTSLLDGKQLSRGSILIGRDVTERHFAEARIRNSEQLLYASQKLASIGSWEFDTETENFACTQTLCEIFGLNELLTTVEKDSFLNCIPAAERYALMNAFERLKQESGAVTMTHCIMTPDGQEKIVTTQFELTLDENGGRNRLVGAVQDVTRQQKDQSRLRHAAVAFENSVEATILLDKQGVIVDVNSAFERLSGYRVSDAIGKTPALIRSSRHDSDFYDDVWKKVKESGFWQGKVWRKNASGVEYAEALTVSKVVNGRGDLDGYVLQSYKSTQEQIAEDRTGLSS